LKKYYLKVYISLFLIMGFYSCAQGDKNWILDQKDLSSKTEILSKENFYDALRFRTDLKLNSNKRILFTSIKNIEEFKQKYKQTDMTLDYVIRDRLHTAIFLGQKRNFLQSMDGSVFNLPDNYPAKELTDQVIAVIGAMYYGNSEVEQLENN
tara:strand:- start:16698 stop:17153 length:456 start_codon:yes stop_codon:yes gene_type:complete